jgi:transcriptional regulator with XRE-family HTH domain
MLFPLKGAEIKRLREENHWSREMLARIARCSVSTLYLLENERRDKADEKLIERISAAFAVSPRVIAPDYVPPTAPYTSRVRYNRNMLKNRRSELGLTLDEVARKAGLSKEAIGKLEHKDSCEPATIRKVARALGLVLEEVAPVFKAFPGAQERELFGDAAFTRPEFE